MIQSRNPILSRQGSRGGPAPQGGPGYGGQGYDQGYQGYGPPPTAGSLEDRYRRQPTRTSRLTLDDVVAKTGITIGLVVLVAVATWAIVPDGMLVVAMGLGAITGLVLGLVNAFKREVSPPLVLAYAAAQGVFVGGFSKIIEYAFGTGSGGLVVSAVLGTMCAAGATLAVYKFANIQVTPRFQRFVLVALVGFVMISLVDLVLYFFGFAIGVNGFGAMGLLFSVIGLALGVLMLILDFDQVERAVAAGAPEKESWRLAFGLTVTLIWMYIEMLRILAILRGE